MKRIAFLALATFTAPLTAFAGGPVTPVADAYVEAPVVITPTRADGDWGGFYAGGQLGWANVTSGGAGLDGNGVMGGVHAGYRYDMGRAVLGAELDYNIGEIELGNDVTDDSLDSVARLKLMAGADLGRTLVYVTAGAAYAEATLAGNSASGDGYFAGVGMDYQLSETWTVGGELLGHRFEDFDDTGVDLEAVTLQAKVAYRF